MQAIILAAGLGKRLKEYTKDVPKCMVTVNGVTMIERLLRQLDDKGLSGVTIVTGYKEETLRKYVGSLGLSTPIAFIDNPIYDKTNNIYSLALAKDRMLEDDTALFESDLVFDDAIIDRILSDTRSAVAVVAKYEDWMDGTCVTVDSNDLITRFIPKKDQIPEERGGYYKTVNVYRFSKEFAERFYIPFMDAYRHAMGENEYYEQVLRIITMLDKPMVGALVLENEKWYEIDNAEDLANAAKLFAVH